MKQGFSPLAKGLALRQPSVITIAGLHGKTPSQVLVRWSLQSNIPSIPKSTKLERVMENSKVVHQLFFISIVYWSLNRCTE